MNEKNLAYSFYGDQVRWFIGVVEEVGTDEPKLGRVRVRIHGIHDSRDQVPINDLPQAQVLVPTTEPGISGLGRNPYLEKGATVFGVFLDGKASQLPLVLGSIPVIEVPSADQLENPIGPSIESGTLEGDNRIFRTGTRTANNNTTTITSTLLGGADMDAPAGAPYPASLSERKQIAWEFFTSRGWGAAQAAGIIGNLVAESNLIPVAEGDIGLHSPTDISIGIAQWYSGGGRDRLLFEFARKKNKPWSDYRTQLEFVDYELNNYSALGGYQLRNATNPTTAALIVQRKYEIPALDGGLSPIDGAPSRLHEAKRVKVANEVYNTFTRGVA
jgi:hypothetical protein